jgi:hypothetical protein
MSIVLTLGSDDNDSDTAGRVGAGVAAEARKCLRL